MENSTTPFWPIQAIQRINRWKDLWLESAFRRYAADLRVRYPAKLKWWEKICAPAISNRFTGTVANLISAIRILLAVLVVGVLLAADDVIGFEVAIITALAIFIVAGILDLLDGPAARALNEVSEAGKILDPLADKILLAVPLIMLGWIFLPAYIFWIILSLEIILMLIAGLKMAAGRLPFVMASQASMAGKVKNVVELISGGFLFLAPFGEAFAVISSGLFLVAIPLAAASIVGYIGSVRKADKKPSS